MVSRTARTSRITTAIACAMLAVLAAACGGSGGGSGGGSLLVGGMTPADGTALNPTLPPAAVRGHEVKIFFTTEPDPATVLDASEFNGLSANVRFVDRALRRVQGWAFVGGVDASGRGPLDVDPDIDPGYAADIAADEATVLRFIFDTDGRLSTPEVLAPDQYTFVITEQVTNRKGRGILEPFCGAFTSGPDTYAPVVRFERPANGASGVDLDAVYEFEFNESVVPSSVIGVGTSPVTLAAKVSGGPPGAPPLGLAIGGSVTALSSNGCRFVFTPASRLPGSSQGQSVRIETTIAGGAVRDAGGNVMMDPHTSTFTMREGPTISNNPIPPNALWFGSTSPPAVGVVAVNSVGSDPLNPFLIVDTNADGIPTPADDNTLIANSVNGEVGSPVDIVIGSFINTSTSFACIPPGLVLPPGLPPPFANPPSMLTPPVPNPAMPLPLGNTATLCFGTVCGLTTPVALNTPIGQNADLGNYVYVADDQNNLIRTLNSNTSLEIDQTAVPDPAGMTITANLESLLVTNFATNSVTLLDVTGGTPNFVKEITINPRDAALGIGRGPRAIAAQPDNEDVLVINTRDESMTILSQADGFEARKVVASSIGPDPIDVAATWRQPPFTFGGTQTWFAYVTNRGGNSISIFESGPTFPVLNGPDDIRIVIENSADFSIDGPTRLHTDLATGIFGDGVFWLNSGSGTVGHATLTFIGPPPSPYFPNPAPSRVWGQAYVTSSFGPGVQDLALGDNPFVCGLIPNPNLKNNFGQIFAPIKGYVATGSGIRVFDAVTSLDLGVNIPIQGVNQLTTYWKQ